MDEFDQKKIYLFIGVNFSLKLNFFGHTHSVILNWSSEHSLLCVQIYAIIKCFPTFKVFSKFFSVKNLLVFQIFLAFLLYHKILVAFKK